MQTFMIRTNHDILQLSQEGLSCKAIMKITGLSYHSIYHTINKKSKIKSPSEQNKKEAYEAYLGGMKIAVIAREFNITQQVIKNYIEHRREDEAKEHYLEMSKVVSMAWK